MRNNKNGHYRIREMGVIGMREKELADEIEYIRSYALSFSHIENIDQTDPMLFEFAYDVYQRTNYILEELEK